MHSLTAPLLCRFTSFLPVSSPMALARSVPWFSQVLAGSSFVVLLNCLISSLNKPSASECTRKASECTWYLSDGHPTAMRNFTWFGWVSKPTRFLLLWLHLLELYGSNAA